MYARNLGGGASQPAKQPAAAEVREKQEAEGEGGGASRGLREATAMGDSSGSVSVDVERIFFGGKVRAPPPLDFFSSISVWAGCIRVERFEFGSSLPWGLSLLFLG